MLDKEGEWCFPAKLLRAVDGDTADMELDLGLRQYTRDRFRLLGVDTPERGKEGFLRAKQYLQSFESQEFIVYTHKVGKYGRWLATLYLKDEWLLEDCQSINDKILALGLGVPYGS